MSKQNKKMIKINIIELVVRKKERKFVREGNAMSDLTSLILLSKKNCSRNANMLDHVLHYNTNPQSFTS